LEVRYPRGYCRMIRMEDRGSTQQRKQSFEDHDDDGFVDEVNDVGLHPLSKLIGKESDSHFSYSPLPRKRSALLC
jgi:hypothetical protein